MRKLLLFLTMGILLTIPQYTHADFSRTYPSSGGITAATLSDSTLILRALIALKLNMADVDDSTAAEIARNVNVLNKLLSSAVDDSAAAEIARNINVLNKLLAAAFGDSFSAHSLLDALHLLNSAIGDTLANPHPVGYFDTLKYNVAQVLTTFKWELSSVFAPDSTIAANDSIQVYIRGKWANTARTSLSWLFQNVSTSGADTLGWLCQGYPVTDIPDSGSIDVAVSDVDSVRFRVRISNNDGTALIDTTFTPTATGFTTYKFVLGANFDLAQKYKAEVIVMAKSSDSASITPIEVW